MTVRSLVLGLAVVLQLSQPGLAGPVIEESARQIPVACRVDVVVVGGSTGAVAAAVRAAESGAKTFLAAPYPYLGDDMTATLRLWLEEGETPVSPLACKLFQSRPETDADPNRLSFTYQTDRPSAAPHKDTSPPSRLTGGQWDDPVHQSVQYAGDVIITADLGQVKEIQRTRVIGFRRKASGNANSGFDVASIAVSVSDDRKSWKHVASLDKPTVEGTAGNEELIEFVAPMGSKTRYVRLTVKKPEDYPRLLLGQVELIGPRPASAAAGARRVVRRPTPMQVKKTLDEALLAAGVSYLYSCYATDVLRDGSGNPCGVVMANRAGRQAVVAKTIIDATDRASVARMAGARFRPSAAGPRTFRRVVIGGEPRTGDHLAARVIGPPFRGPYPNQARTSSGDFKVIEYTLQLPMADDSYAAWAAADQQARTLTYHPEQQFTSDRLFEVPGGAIVSRLGIGEETSVGSDVGRIGNPSGNEADLVDGLPIRPTGKPTLILSPTLGAMARPEALAGEVPLAACQPAQKSASRLYVLGGCVDLSRPEAGKIVRPLALLDLGSRIGKAAAEEAKSLPQPTGVRLAGARSAETLPLAQAATPGTCEVREVLRGIRPTQSWPTVPQDARDLPILGRYDVVVVGGGTGGAAAGIGSARQGAKTLVVEYLSGLGGVGTQGAIESYWFGNRVGFSATVSGGAASWLKEQKAEWWRSELLKAGAEIWFGTIGCGAVVKDRRVVGAVVATPEGRGVVLAKAVIDATGNADLAAAAGARTVFTDASEFAMQGTGLPGFKLGDRYDNTDFTITDETDLVDIWHMFVMAKNKYPQAFDEGKLIDTRERRRIVGDFTITLADEILGRTYPDSIVRARSNFDTHGYTVDPYTCIEHPQTKLFYVYEPYRAMLPAGLEGLLVTGLGISAHRDASPLIRTQADIQNGGYAAGVVAAAAARYDLPLRKVDLHAVQAHLVAMGNLPASVLTDKDSCPLPQARLAEAVRELPEGKGGAAVFAEPKRAIPLLRQAYAAAGGKEKRTYALVLALLGDASGADLLRAEVEQADGWGAGWNYRGMGQFGQALGPLDITVVALGYAKDRRALPAILKHLGRLTDESAFSHHRAAGLALELIGDPAAAKPLAGLLAKAGMSGHCQASIGVAIARETPGGVTAENTRRESLRELLLARALYRCGDFQGIGEKTLRTYTADLRGHLAQHAKAVLDAGKAPGRQETSN